MIIHRSFYKEATISTLATVLVLALLVVSQKAVFILSGAAAGDIKATWVATLLALDLILDFDLLMQLALFVGLLVTLNRWYRDSEMVVLASCGISIMDLLRPVAIFTMIFAVVISVLVFVIRPAAFHRIQEVRQENADKVDVGTLAAGRFNSANGYTYYVEKTEAGGNPDSVFIYRQQKQGVENIFASKISQRTDPRSGQRVLELGSGSIYLGQPGAADYQITRFDLYELNLLGGLNRTIADHVEGVSLTNLMNFPDQARGQAELQTRLGKPVVLFIFAGIAMLLSYSDPRRGNYRSLFVAIFIFFFYLTLLQYVRDMIKVGQAPYSSMWLVQGLAIFIVYRLLLRRNRGQPLLILPKMVRR